MSGSEDLTGTPEEPTETASGTVTPGTGCSPSPAIPEDAPPQRSRLWVLVGLAGLAVAGAAATLLLPGRHGRFSSWLLGNGDGPPMPEYGVRPVEPDFMPAPDYGVRPVEPDFMPAPEYGVRPYEPDVDRPPPGILDPGQGPSGG